MKKTAMFSSKLLVLGAMLFISIILISLTHYGTLKTAPDVSIQTHDRNDVFMDGAFYSEVSWYSTEPKTVPDFFKYLHWTNIEACNLPTDFGGHIYKTNQFVGMDGQKTVCLDNGVAPDPKSCVVYSFGINNDWSFDDTMAKYGCHVLAFDPSMETPDHNRTDKVKFFRTGLGTEDVDKDGRGWKIRTFPTLKRELGHDVIDILKIDIEGDEWSVLKQLLNEGSLDKVKQLAVEVHLEKQKDIKQYVEKYWDILSGIEFVGFTRFSSKGNPWMRYPVEELGTSDFFGYEIAWYNKKFKV